MASVLVLKSSILGEFSSSTKLIDGAIEQSGNDHFVIERDLAAHPVPMLDGEIMAGLRGAENPTQRQQDALALSEQLINEIQACDTLLIAAPMYNFTVPTQLKNWFDLIARAGVTFAYTEQGPKGLLTGKKAIVVTTRGGLHKDTSRDHITGYLTTLLNFVGITDIEFVYSEALAMGEAPAAESFQQASNELSALMS